MQDKVRVVFSFHSWRKNRNLHAVSRVFWTCNGKPLFHFGMIWQLRFYNIPELHWNGISAGRKDLQRRTKNSDLFMKADSQENAERNHEVQCVSMLRVYVRWSKCKTKLNASSNHQKANCSILSASHRRARYLKKPGLPASGQFSTFRELDVDWDSSHQKFQMPSRCLVVQTYRSSGPLTVRNVAGVVLFDKRCWSKEDFGFCSCIVYRNRVDLVQQNTFSSMLQHVFCVVWFFLELKVLASNV